MATSKPVGLRAALAVAAILLVAACSSGGGGITEPKPTTTPLAFLSEPTEEPAPTLTEEPEPTAKPLSVKVVKRTKSVQQNGTASVTIKTSKKADCSIDVQYLSGSATAKGLGDKSANADGQVTWKWKVGGKTTEGTWPIYIRCVLGERTGDVDTEFTVK
jgi:hypothetical protein